MDELLPFIAGLMIGLVAGCFIARSTGYSEEQRMALYEDRAYITCMRSGTDVCSELAFRYK